MELINATKMNAGYTMGMDPSGREYLVVVVKGTFKIPAPEEEAVLADEQLPLIEADTFTGEPGLSAPIYESDYCLRKPKCDVLLLGSAHAPERKPVRKMQVGMHIGPITKIIEVVGNRTWSGMLKSPGKPEPFVTMPITYDRAYGGIDDSNPKKAKAYNSNLAGVGYYPNRSASELKNLPVPNLQEPDKDIDDVSGNYGPMSFGPIGRSWAPRPAYAGTYDKKWLEETFPFLPEDFDDRYFQAAPEDQQMNYPKSGELVSLVNLTPNRSKCRFNLPLIELPITFFPKKGKYFKSEAVVDTLVFEPDRDRFSIVWRTSVALKNNVFEMPQALIGEMSKAWWRARESGKTYYSDLAQAYTHNKEELEE